MKLKQQEPFAYGYLHSQQKEIQGKIADGNDLCNELTYDVLKVAREYGYNMLNITMRFHSGSPESAWDAAVARQYGAIYRPTGA